jgi:hypothetical protein
VRKVVLSRFKHRAIIEEKSYSSENAQYSNRDGLNIDASPDPACIPLHKIKNLSKFLIPCRGRSSRPKWPLTLDRCIYDFRKSPYIVM